MRELTKIEQLKKFGVAHSVCFSGPRPSKLPDNGDYQATSIIQMKTRLEEKIECCLDNGKSIFLNGCMSGFDILAGETVLKIRQYRPEIVCVTVAPFRIDFFENANWTPEWKRRALGVYLQSNLSFSLSENYRKGIYYERDRFLVDHSSLLICYYAGTGGGTKYTLDYAQQNSVLIQNVFMEESL